MLPSTPPFSLYTAQLSTVRREVKGDLDEVTGLSDILRGTTDSRETLGGLRLKNNNAGTRLNDRQNEVARYAKDIVVLMAEVISKHFSDESLIECSGILYEEELQPEAIVAELKASISKQQMQALQQPAPQPQLAPPQQPPMPAPQQMPQQPQTGTNVVPFSGGQPPQQMVPQPPPPPSPEMIDQMFAQQAQQVIQGKVAKAISLLRQDMPRKYRIDIETDSTIFADAMQERQDATEFITATMSFMANAEKLGQGMPEALPLFGKFLQFGVRKFRAGRDLESSIDTFVKQIDKKAKEMVENPPPSPEMMKVQAEMQKTQLDGKIQEANDQRDMQRQQADDERQAQIQQTDDQRRLMMEQAKDQAMIKSLELKSQIETKQIQEEMIQSERDAQYKREEHAFRMEELELKRKERVENKVSNG